VKAPSEAALAELQRVWWGDVDELGRTEPHAADRLVTALVSHLRSHRPECVASISLGPPTDRAAIRDPRSA
jgi:hypothetical protein